VLSESRSFTDVYDLIPVPPVHRISRREISALRRLLGRTRLLIAQPVNNGYRSLGLGLDEMAESLPRDAQVVRWAPLYWDALFPFSVTIHRSNRRKVRAPVVGHHDLRLLVGAHHGDDEMGRALFGAPEVSGSGVRFVLENCESRLRAREEHCDVKMLDFVSASDVEPHAFHSFNHPTRLVLEELASRVHSEVGLSYEINASPAADEPLGDLRLPLEAPVLQARSLQTDSREDWIRHGRLQPRAEIAQRHLSWYREHSDVVEAGITEHRDRCTALGLQL
jgi:hypothetical protein